MIQKALYEYEYACTYRLRIIIFQSLFPSSWKAFATKSDL